MGEIVDNLADTIVSLYYEADHGRFAQISDRPTANIIEYQATFVI
jgi:hypothetical protein